MRHLIDRAGEEAEDRPEWYACIFSFRGLVQMVGLRKELMDMVYELGLQGHVENDVEDVNLVIARLGGRSYAMDEFKEFCESSICEGGVEMEVEANPTQRQTMAKPAYRKRNTMGDIDDRFDQALIELRQINANFVVTHQKLDLNNQKLDQIIEITASTKADTAKLIEIGLATKEDTSKLIEIGLATKEDTARIVKVVEIED